MDAAELAHLLRRTEFVAKPARIAAFADTVAHVWTRGEVIDDILDVTTPIAIPSYIDHDIDGEGYEQWTYAVQWWLNRMVDSPKPMQEKMTWFWHGHFCSSWDKVNSAWAMLNQNRLFRDSAFGNFRTMAQTMALQPAMLFYLDNLDNVKTSPNQNFARELMELFTLGVVDANGTPNYIEDDVTAAARAWTGHGINWDTYDYKFWSGDHDDGQKKFMGVTKNWNGPDIIDHILGNPAVVGSSTVKKLQACKYLTKKLWEYLAYQNPAQQLVDEVAQVLYDGDFAIKPWVKALLLRDEFYTQEAREGLVKSPVDFVVTAMHFTGYRGADLNPQWYVEGMGQVPFAPPNVAGWKTNGYWVNTSVFGARAEFARDITWHLRQNGNNAVASGRTPAQAADFVAQMFGLNLSTVTRNALISYLTTETNSWWDSTNLLTMAMMTPEFHVA